MSNFKQSYVEWNVHEDAFKDFNERFRKEGVESAYRKSDLFISYFEHVKRSEHGTVQYIDARQPAQAPGQ